jgi:hypothetical protein
MIISTEKKHRQISIFTDKMLRCYHKNLNEKGETGAQVPFNQYGKS